MWSHPVFSIASNEEIKEAQSDNQFLPVFVKLGKGSGKNDGAARASESSATPANSGTSEVEFRVFKTVNSLLNYLASSTTIPRKGTKLSSEDVSDWIKQDVERAEHYYLQLKQLLEPVPERESSLGYSSNSNDSKVYNTLTKHFGNK